MQVKVQEGRVTLGVEMLQRRWHFLKKDMRWQSRMKDFLKTQVLADGSPWGYSLRTISTKKARIPGDL